MIEVGIRERAQEPERTMKTKSEDELASVFGYIVAAPIVLSALLLVMLWFGWATAILWGWFITPTFGLPPITIHQAAGLALVMGCLRAKVSAPKEDTSWGLTLFTMVAGPPIAVGFGWVIKWLAA